MAEPEYMDDLSMGGTKSAVIPAYEYVKRNILYNWFSIEREYQDYIFKTSLNTTFRRERLTSQLLTLYRMMLRPMMLKMDKEHPFVKEADSFIKNKYVIPEDKLESVIEQIGDFLHKIGLTNIAYEQKPWEDRLKDSYGVF